MLHCHGYLNPWSEWICCMKSWQSFFHLTPMGHFKCEDHPYSALCLPNREENKKKNGFVIFPWCSCLQNRTWDNQLEFENVSWLNNTTTGITAWDPKNPQEKRACFQINYRWHNIAVIMQISQQVSLYDMTTIPLNQFLKRSLQTLFFFLFPGLPLCIQAFQIPHH